MNKNNALLLIFPKRGRLIFIFSIFLAYFLTIVSNKAFATTSAFCESLIQTQGSAQQDTLNSVFHEDFESSNLQAWKQTSDWEVSSVGNISGLQSLKHLEKPTGGISSIFHSMSINWHAYDIQWSYTLKNGTWDPSASNRFWFYLSADTISTEHINGWAAGVNMVGNGDLLELWRITNGRPDSLIIQSDLDWNATTIAVINVKRTSQGNWSLTYQKAGEPVSTPFTGQDPMIYPFKNAGFCFEYTYTRSGELWLDDISIQESASDLYIQKLSILNPGTLMVAFNRPINPSSVENNDFSLTDENNLQIPVLQVSATGNPCQGVEIKIGKVSGVQLHLIVSGISDLSGQIMKPESRSFPFSFSPEAGSVLINEVLFNPLTGEADFVELINVSEAAVPVNRLKLATRNDTLALRQVYALTSVPKYLKPLQYLTCTKDSMSVMSVYFTHDPLTVCSMKSFPTLADDAGTVVLLNDSLRVIDEFSYTAKMHSPFLANPNGVSLERISTLKPTMEQNNWTSAASAVGFATPGVRNSQATSNESIEETILPEPVIFSPNGDGTNDQMTIRYNLNKPDYMANVRIFDIAGRPVKLLVRNESLATHGTWTWQGDSDSGQRLSLGVYIILVELYDLQGHNRTFKKTCTIADRLK
ncbi:MAG TPA: gliding motility-associated C-terminal domain-containing protein [Prolixibacteraceae bacterium]|nr:gliding motility-associated C-terminal domain-containing protein [Prolixibacteraceae bacterium]